MYYTFLKEKKVPRLSRNFLTNKKFLCFMRKNKTQLMHTTNAATVEQKL